jgi:small-conductance mechanosensitive channel
MTPDDILGQIFFGNTVLHYLKALALFLAFMLLAYIVIRLMDRLFQWVGKRFGNPLICLMLKSDKRLHPILKYLPIFMVAHYLSVPAKAVRIVDAIWLIIVAFCVVRFVQDALKALVSYQVEHGKADQQLVSSVGLISPIILYPLAALFVMSNLGFNITTLLAGLGVGGVAVALASQTFLGDLFNYFTIIIGKPFNLGDFVEVDEISGTVNSIGLKGTRITSVSGEQVIISNTDMTKGVLKNYHIMTKRRTKFILGIRYDTPNAKVKALPGLIKSIIEDHKECAVDQVSFKEFGDSALNFVVSYYVLSPAAAVSAQVNEEINFAIMDMLEREEIGLAFPSSSIYMEK